MVDVAQLVRVVDCGSIGRGFKSPLPPEKEVYRKMTSFLLIFYDIVNSHQNPDQAEMLGY